MGSGSHKSASEEELDRYKVETPDHVKGKVDKTEDSDDGDKQGKKQ